MPANNAQDVIDLSDLPERTVLALYPVGSKKPYVVRLQEDMPHNIGRHVTVLEAAEEDFRDPEHQTFLATANYTEADGPLNASNELSVFNFQGLRMPTLRFFPGCAVSLRTTDHVNLTNGGVVFFLDRVEVVREDEPPTTESPAELDLSEMTADHRLYLDLRTDHGPVAIVLRRDYVHASYRVMAIQDPARLLALDHYVDISPDRLLAGERVVMSNKRASLEVAGTLTACRIQRGYYAP